MNKHPLLLLGILYLIIGSLPGFSCSPRPESADEIVFWAMGAEGENVQKLIPEFERRNPGIRVRLQSIPWTAAHEKLLTAYAGNSTPDLAQLGNTWIPEFTLLNSLENLDRWIATSPVIRPANYFPGIWETNIVDSSAYGIPWYVDTRVLFYRTDILNAAGYDHSPRTWDELYDVSKKIVRQSKGEEKYAILLPTNEWAPFVAAGLQAGSGLLKDDDRYGDFSGAKFRTSFEFLMKFYDEKLAPVGITRVTNIYQGISEGFFSMYITGPWNIGEFQKRLPPELQNKWMTAPLPGYGATTPGVSLAGGSSLVMFERSAKKTQAWKFVEYLSEVEQQLQFSRITGDLPAVRETWGDTSFAGNKYIRAFYDQLEHVVPTPKIPEWEQIAMKVQQHAEVASIHEKSVADALAALDNDVDLILEKRRWMMAQEKHE
jgi:multiple sugar transport system substrate-binding protein